MTSNLELDEIPNMTKLKLENKEISTNGTVNGTVFTIKDTDEYPFESQSENAGDANSHKETDNKFDYLFKRMSILKSNKSPVDPNTGTKLYRRRFWMLTLFCMTSALNGSQWIQYSVISNIIECYYDVTMFDVNWGSLLYMVLYIPLVLPAALYLDRYGLRITLLTGSFLTLTSTIIQCFSQNTTGFLIAMISQTVAAIAQVCILPLPPRVATAWFGPLEVCRATAVGVFGNQVGIALGFVFTPLMVPVNCSDKEAIRHSRSIVAYVLVACNAVVFFLQYFTFQPRPQFPPSPAEAQKVEKTNYKKSLFNLIKNRNFDLLLLSYGLLTGVFLSLSTVLNEIIIPIFPDSLAAVGWMGLVVIISGLFGSVLAGYILDKTHKFKFTSVAINILTLLFTVVFSGILYLKILWAQFVVAAVMGFFMTSYLSVGFEFASELTYPEPEGTTANLMNVSSMSFAAALTGLGSYLLENHGILAANSFFCATLAVSCVVTAVIKPALKRTEQNLGIRNENTIA